MEFRVLGPLELWDGGGRVEVSAAKQRALLALLLLHPGQVLSSDRLIDDLWEGSPPPAARTTLQSCVYRLRRLIAARDPAVALRTRPTGYLLEIATEALDLARFDSLVSSGRSALDSGDLRSAAGALRSGLRLWRDHAFADIDLLAVRGPARRLDDIRLDVVEECVAIELRLGEHSSIVPELAALTVRHPLRERLWELLMVALYRSGRQAEALSAYQRLYRRLDRELGVEPNPAVRDLQRKILMADPVRANPVESGLGR